MHLKKKFDFHLELFFKLWVSLIMVNCVCCLFLYNPLSKKIFNTIANPLTFVIQWIFFVLGAVTAGAYIATRWIDHPFRKLIEMITEIGRGNFSIRIPEQKNKQMRRLAKLVNYMAEEMDHLQQINVSHIINEKNKTETILHHIAEGVLVIDPDDRILVINVLAEKWFGLDEKTVLKKPIKECIRNRNLLSMLKEIREGKTQASTEFRLKSKETGEEQIFESHAVQVFSKENKFIGAVAVIRDVTKEREADRIKTELVSMVAHELKSPLTSIYGFSELLVESRLDSNQAKEYAQVILSESKRLTDFVNKFLDLSKLESNKIQIKMVPFDLKQVALQVAESFQAQLDKKEIQLILQIPDHIPNAFGDQNLIEQVLINLISNAIKYSPKHSKVGVEANPSGKELLINVIDNGYGIPQEALPHLFEKFYRVPDMEGHDEIEGSGLGLALVKEIVEQHGGQIHIKSKLGVGSVFSFTVPASNFSNAKNSIWP